MPDTAHPFTNRLAREKSPYLLQHAHNPVNWYPWGAEALERARNEDKPIFLSIGYSACHWCHVMERESFENPDVAALVNRYFVPIKVDREERPDVDEIYMTAVQRMTGSGGWPLSLFLLPDGRPFYGGTYFPPEGRHGRIAFPSLVTQLGDAFHTRRDELEEVAASIVADLLPATRQAPLPHAGQIHPSELIAGAVAELSERFDAEHGGFGSAPKFPPHHALRLLLAAVRDGDEDGALPLLTMTLDKMALGGIYDHVGGGFHRYATDGVWLLPHFEKMLYDNALLLRVYSEAADLLDSPACARVARETADWCLRDLLHEGTGGFEAALDADSEGIEGKYYVWTEAEVRSVVGDADGAAFARAYQFHAQGNFREEATGHRTGENIPHLSISSEPFPLPAALPSDIARSRDLLLARRYERVPPGKDDKIITAWNGLIIGALAFAGKALGEPRYLDAARRASECTLTTLKPGGELLRRYAKGEAAIPAYLDDYAFLADGLLDLADATGEARWVSEATTLTQTLIERFWDETDGGFYYSGTGHESLIATSKDFFDGATPSPNGVAARVLARLGNYEGGERYAGLARVMLTNYHGLMARAPQATASLILAAREAGGAAPHPPVRDAISLRAVDPSLTLTQGGAATARFRFTVADGYHVNARFVPRADLIPTVAMIGTSAPAAIGPVTFPAETEYDDGAGEKLPVYVGETMFALPIAAAANAVSGTYSVTLTIRAQPCTDTECLAPVERSAVVTLNIVGGGQEVPEESANVAA